MLPYCLKCTITTESKNPNVGKTRNRGRMLFSKCKVCESKNLTLSKSRKLVDYEVVLK